MLELPRSGAQSTPRKFSLWAKRLRPEVTSLSPSTWINKTSLWRLNKKKPQRALFHCWLEPNGCSWACRHERGVTWKTCTVKSWLYILLNILSSLWTCTCVCACACSSIIPFLSFFLLLRAAESLASGRPMCYSLAWSALARYLFVQTQWLQRTIETQAASRETLVLHHSLPCRHDWDTPCVCARMVQLRGWVKTDTSTQLIREKKAHTVSPLKRASYNYEEKCWNGSSHPWVIGYECNLWHTHSYTRRTQKDWNHKATGHTRLWIIPKQMVLSDQTQKKKTLHSKYFQSMDVFDFRRSPTTLHFLVKRYRPDSHSVL